METNGLVMLKTGLGKEWKKAQGMREGAGRSKAGPVCCRSS